MPQVPLLLVGDAVDQVSGLARITRDLCSVLSGQPGWRIASLGYLGRGTVRMAWQQYHMPDHPDPVVALQASLPGAVDDFFQGQQGVVLTIWDLTRLLWLARPEYCPDDGLREWIVSRRSSGSVRLWAYVPVDSTGPDGRLTGASRECLLGFDRLLAYTPFGEEVIRRTIGDEEANARGLGWLPHGVQGRTFHGRRSDADTGREGRDKGDDHGRDEREAGNSTEQHRHVADNHRTDVGADDADTGGTGGGSVPSALVIGIVATNQARKDWGLMAAVCSGIVRLHPDVRLWWHTDTLLRYWSLEALTADYGLARHVEITLGTMTDYELAERYRSCRLTLHPGLGEGWGLTVFESLACDVPAVHGDYAGGASILRTCGLAELLVPASDWRVEGQHNCVRPVFWPEEWLAKIAWLLQERREPGYWAGHVEHLAWTNIAGRWRGWLRDGLRNVTGSQ